MEFLTMEEEIEIMLDGKDFEEFRREKTQEVAQDLVKREMERMRKKAGLKKLLSYMPEVKVVSVEEWLKEKDNIVVGGYVNRENIIFLPEYKFYEHDFDEIEWLSYEDIKPKYKKNDDLVLTIRHELTHLFTRERFKSDFLINIENDSSTIFLYFLAFFEGGFGAGYKVQSKYENEVKEKIKGLTYEEIQSICLKFLGRLEMAFEPFKKLMIFAFDKDQEDYHIEERNGCMHLFLGYNIANYDYKKINALKDKILDELEKRIIA